MIDTHEVINNLPRDGRVVIRCKQGAIVSVRCIYENEHVATFNALIDLAKLAGYSVVTPEGNTL